MVRVAELRVAPGTSPKNLGREVLLLTCEFSDGQFRSVHWTLDKLVDDMLKDDGTIVTEEYKRIKAGRRGVTMAALGEVLEPFADAVGSEVRLEVGRLRQELALANAKIAKLEGRP